MRLPTLSAEGGFSLRRLIDFVCSPWKASDPIEVMPDAPTPVNEFGVMSTGELNDRLNGPKVSAALVIDLGFKPVHQRGAGVFWNVSDFPHICDALVERIKTARKG